VVVGGGAFFDKALPCAVQTEDDLLVFFLDRDETHGRASDGFADGVGRGVLAALAAQAVRGDELGGDELDGVAVGAEQPGSMVCAGAGFQADQARRQFRNEQR